MGRPPMAVGVALLALLAGGCLGRPAPPGPPTPAGTAPAPIPIPWLVASREANWGYRVSPDGARLAWIASHRGRTTLFFRTLDTGEGGIVDTHSPRSVVSFTWARDSRRLLYLQDRDGDEDHHVYLASLDAPEARPVDLTPWPGARSYVERTLRSDAEHVILGSNRRDRTVFDLYRVRLSTGEATLVAENPGDVVDWMTDLEGRPRARLRHAGPDTRHLEVRRGQAWVRLQTYDIEEMDVRMLGMTPDERGIWLLSSRGRDRRALLRMDVDTSVETLVHGEPDVDVDRVTLSERTREPLVAYAHPDYPRTTVFARDLAGRLARLARPAPTGMTILGLDDAERRATVEVYTDKGYEYYLVEPAADPVLVGRSHTMAFADSLATVEPVVIPARDGLRLHGYLARPPGYRAPGGLVLHVHGGHWARDYWRYDRIVQFFATRGYAVLQVNYRGSTGYGRRFLELAIGEYAGKMHDDLVDAVRWAVARGVADPARVAIHGGSYGGYAALVGMTFTPDVFACGVSVVGMSSLVTLYENMPAYWKVGFAPRFHKYVGDPRRPEDRARLEAKSPLFKADRVQRPILIIHGANDARVKVSESEQMVEALRSAGKDVRYVSFPDEGHRRDYGNWRNAVRHYTEIERFLAECLGRPATTSR